jgi:hypothetical protein
MGTATRAMIGASLLAAALAAPAGAQTELDRFITRVNNHVVTSSDVRQVRLLGLVDDTSSDDAALRGLEDRLLLLDEIARPGAVPLPPSTDADLAARRAAWEAGAGGPAEAQRLLARSGMTEARLDAWLRDDLRIRAYLQRQFGALPEAARQTATADLLTRLRQRAGLK